MKNCSDTARGKKALDTVLASWSLPLSKRTRVSTLNECEVSMQDIYDKYKLLKANYPVEVEYKTNDNKQKYIIYTYKPDYTKPKVTTYYHCLKAYKK